MALDAADLAELGKMIAAAVAPIAANVSPEALAKAVTPIIEAQNKAAGFLTAADVAARETAAAEKVKADAKVEADRIAAEKATGDDKSKGKVDSAVVALQAQLAALTAKNAENEAAVKAANDAARTNALHGAARDALVKAGIPADRVAFAMSHLKEQGVLTYEGDVPGWKGVDPKTNVPGVLPMESAAVAWTQADGKLFLPPVGAQGSGDGPGVRSGSRVTVASDIRDANGALNADRAADKFLSALGG